MPPHTRFAVGVLVRGTDRGHYGVTNADMTLAEVLEITPDATNDIRIRVLQHKSMDNAVGSAFRVQSRHFEPVGFCPACRCHFDPEDMADGLCPVCRARLFPV